MKRYFATQDIAISGVEDKHGNPLLFKAGDELIGVPLCKMKNLIQLQQATEKDEPLEQPKPAAPVVVQQQNKPIEQPRKAGGK